MKRRFGGVVPNTAFRILVPLSLVYGVYVLLHGEYSRRFLIFPSPVDGEDRAYLK